jgi:hypothetical protein
MWSGVSRELNDIDIRKLSESELWSYQYLRHELRRAREKASAGQQITVSSSLPGLTDFSSATREQLLSRSYATYTGDQWAFKLQATVVGDPIDDQRYRLDGSYVAGIWGNWALGIGALERWWGPGWQSSLILSNAARPSPGFFIQRVDNEPFDLPVLEWLGPWDLQAFFNQLENNRETSRAKLIGMRVSFKPANQLEIGLSRTAQWGGEGRPEDLRTFWNMVIGEDNRGDGGLDEEGLNEPGNQLGGIDWRLGHNFDGVSAAFYGQIIGEDEAGGLPSHVLGMAGLETAFVWGTSHNRLALEVSNTTMEFNKGGSPNAAYEHPRYPSGYRYKGRPLGASTDNDSELVALKGFHNLANGHQFNWTLGSGKINADGTNRSTPAGNVFGAGTSDLWYTTAEYALPIGDQSRLRFGGQYYNNPLQIRDEVVDSSLHVTYELRL